MVSSVLNEGARGLQNSQREMLKAASEIARANVRDDTPSSITSVNTETTFTPVNESTEINRSEGFGQSLVELRKQEQVFNASAQLVSVADETLGSLLDVTS